MLWREPTSLEGFNNPRVYRTVLKVSGSERPAKALLCTPQAKDVRTADVPHPEIVMHHKELRVWIPTVFARQVAGWLMGYGVSHLSPYPPIFVYGKV